MKMNLRFDALDRLTLAVLRSAEGDMLRLQMDPDTAMLLHRFREEWHFDPSGRDGHLEPRWRGMRVDILYPDMPVFSESAVPSAVIDPTPFAATVVVRRFDNKRLEYHDHPENAAPFNTGIKVVLP